MDLKILLGILNRPWMIEPSQADYWGNIVSDLLAGRIMSVPSTDRRNRYSDFFRVDANNNITQNGSVQVLSINGPIGKYDFCGSAGSQSIQQAVRAANQDNTIESIVLLIDSPGGQVDGTEGLANEIKASKKPVVAFVDGTMASAAYWIGSSAREIIVDKSNNGFNAMVGSIGTMAMWADNSKMREIQGVKVHKVYATKSTDKNQSFEKANAGDYTDLVKELDNLNETFLSAVEINRQGKLSKKENVLSGKVYSGNDAVKFGLADRLGTFDMAVKRSLMMAKTIK